MAEEKHISRVNPSVSPDAGEAAAHSSVRSPDAILGDEHLSGTVPHEPRRGYPYSSVSYWATKSQRRTPALLTHGEAGFREVLRNDRSKREVGLMAKSTAGKSQGKTQTQTWEGTGGAAAT